MTARVNSSLNTWYAIVINERKTLCDLRGAVFELTFPRQESDEVEATMRLRDAEGGTALQLVMAMLLRDGAISRMQLTQAIELAIVQLEEVCSAPTTFDPRPVYSSILYLGRVLADIDEQRLNEAELLTNVSRAVDPRWS